MRYQPIEGIHALKKSSYIGKHCARAETDNRKVTYTISGDYLPTVAKLMDVIS